jgi:integrase
LATLSSALGDAVRQRRLPHNPARPAVLPRPPAAERQVWTPQETVRFLRYCRQADPFMADLCEVLIGTGMRKGEALGLHWNDVHLPEQVLYVRYALSAVDNSRLVITSPKTRSSKTWIALSPRVTAALQHRAEAGIHPADPANLFSGLVFCRPDGRPLRPQWVLERFRQLALLAGVPRIAVHDLRHLAATLTITEGVPLTVVSKTLGHATLSTTANIYAHLTHQAARAAVDVIDTVLSEIERPTVRRSPMAWLRPLRDHTPWLRRRTNHHDPLMTAGIWPVGDRPLPAYATTLRPQPPKTQPAGSPRRANPLVTRVGTTGFEPATP